MGRSVNAFRKDNVEISEAFVNLTLTKGHDRQVNGSEYGTSKSGVTEICFFRELYVSEVGALQICLNQSRILQIPAREARPVQFGDPKERSLQVYAV